MSVKTLPSTVLCELFSENSSPWAPRWTNRLPWKVMRSAVRKATFPGTVSSLMSSPFPGRRYMLHAAANPAGSLGAVQPAWANVSPLKAMSCTGRPGLPVPLTSV